VVGALIDMTEQRQAQDELRKAKEIAESSSRSKTTFLASMSHELRTPLNIILGYSHLLQHDHSMTDNQLEKIRTIERSGMHLLEQITDILDAAQIEAGKIVLVPEAVDLRKFVRYVCNFFSTTAMKKGIEFVTEIDKTIPPLLMVDMRRLQQILLNLIGNAVKFTHKGKITVSVQPGGYTQPASAEEFALEISVEDSGIGIAAEEQSQIFEPFVILDSNQAANEGTGLGLSIVQQLVHLMGGAIRLESEAGRGSRFWFELLLRKAEQPFAEEQDLAVLATRFKGEPRRVLVVDDVTDNREMFANILRHLGFRVVTAANGLDALVIARDMVPDLILMDLLMPTLDGYDSLQELRNIPECGAIPVIAMSASVGEAHEALEAGFSAFLAKPISPTVLVKEVADLLQLEREQPDAAIPALAEDTTLPPVEIDECEQLQQWVRLGRMRLLIEWAETLAIRSPQYQEFTDKVIELAKDVDKSTLQSLFARLLE
jgi:CheY-like chemotaxis protein